MCRGLLRGDDVLVAKLGHGPDATALMRLTRIGITYLSARRRGNLESVRGLSRVSIGRRSGNRGAVGSVRGGLTPSGRLLAATPAARLRPRPGSRPPVVRGTSPLSELAGSSGPRHGALHELVEEWDGEGGVTMSRAVDHALRDQRRTAGSHRRDLHAELVGNVA